MTLHWRQLLCGSSMKNLYQNQSSNDRYQDLLLTCIDLREDRRAREADAADGVVRLRFSPLLDHKFPYLDKVT